MRARFLLRPLANQPSDATRNYLPTIDITDAVINRPKIISRVERDWWSWGVLATGSLLLKIADPNRLYAGPGAPSSVFNYGGMDGAELTVEYPTTQSGQAYAAIWRGQISGRGSSYSVRSGTAELLAREITALIREITIPAASLAPAKSIQDLLNAVFDTPGLPTLRYTKSTIEDALQIRDTQEIIIDPLNRNALNVVELALRMADATLSYNAAANEMEVHPRGGGETIKDTLTEFLKITSENPGEEQIYNRIIIQNGAGGRRGIVQTDSAASQQEYGLRSLSLNLRFLQSATEGRSVGEYLITRLNTRRPRVTLQLPVWSITNPADLIPGRNVMVDIPPQAPYGGLRHGGGRAPVGRYQEARSAAIRGTYWIERIEWEPESDTVVATLRLIAGAGVPADGFGEGEAAALGGGTVIAPGSLTSIFFADGAVGPRELADGAITRPKIADGSITGAQVADNTLSGNKFADGTITSQQLAPGALQEGRVLLAQPTQVFTALRWVIHTDITVAATGTRSFSFSYDDQTNSYREATVAALTATAFSTTTPINTSNVLTIGGLHIGRTSANRLIVGNQDGGTHSVRIVI